MELNYGRVIKDILQIQKKYRVCMSDSSNYMHMIDVQQFTE